MAPSRSARPWPSHRRATVVPGEGAAAGLGAQMGRMQLGGGGGGGGFQPPLPAGAPAWQGGHGPAHASEEAGGEEEDWGYVDEHGNWVSFAEGNDEEVEFLKAQLPSEDDFLDGLGADTGPSYADAQGEGGGGDDWGYYDDQGQWVSFGGETNEYLQAAGQAR